MKRTIFVFLVLMFSFTISAQAALVDNGDGTITDTDTNLMWLQDGAHAKTSGYDSDGNMSWDDSMIWADTLDFAGYDDWRLPSAMNSDGISVCYGSSCSDTEMGYLYFIGLDNINNPDWENPQTGPFINITVHYEGCYYSSSALDCWDYYELNAYWTSTTSTKYGPGTDYAWMFTKRNYTVLKSNDDLIYTWAVRDCPTCNTVIPDPPVVPEPISSILFLTGGMLLAGKRFFRR